MNTGQTIFQKFFSSKETHFILNQNIFVCADVIAFFIKHPFFKCIPAIP